MFPALTNKIEILKDRAEMLAKARRFFLERNIVEVDCPLITAGASIDAHIDLIPVIHNDQMRYLHSSPEYGMKRLLSEGIGDIYQLAHVFRHGEISRKHNPEFMMAEWYRMGISFSQMIAETINFIRLFVGDLPSYTISYRQAFLQYADIDYIKCSIKDLLHFFKVNNIEAYPNIEEDGKDALLNIILATIIEPQLGKDSLCALAYYPSTQAALAQTQQRDDETVAERFEVYLNGVELANGYHELANAKEQRSRLLEANSFRQFLGKQLLPIDEFFLQALEKGIPDCCGVAVGFDRLMMLRHNSNEISQVIPFDWVTA
jgi:elongation factor P--(R)-beta-lysine ligase